MAYSYTNIKGEKYYLHKTQVTFRRNKIQKTVYYFARNMGVKAINELPEGFMVMENKVNNLPILKRRDKDLLQRIKSFLQ